MRTAKAIAVPNEMQRSIAEALSRLPLSRGFAQTIARMHDTAVQFGHRQVSLEHLLLAMVDDPEASLILQSSGVDVARLATETSGLLSANPDRFQPGEVVAPSISPELIRILEYSMAAARQSRRGRDINGAIVLAAIVGDGKSAAAQLLQTLGFTFDSAIKALQRSNQPSAPAAEPPRPAPIEETSRPPAVAQPSPDIGATVAPPQTADSGASLPLPTRAPHQPGTAKQPEPPSASLPTTAAVEQALPPPPDPVANATATAGDPPPPPPLRVEPPPAPAVSPAAQLPHAQSTTEDILASVRRRIEAGRAQTGKLIPPLPSTKTPPPAAAALEPTATIPAAPPTPPPLPLAQGGREPEVPVETWTPGAALIQEPPPPLPPEPAPPQVPPPRPGAAEIAASLAEARRQVASELAGAAPTSAIGVARPLPPPLPDQAALAPEDTTKLIAPWPEIDPSEPAAERGKPVSLPTRGPTSAPAGPARGRQPMPKPTIEIGGVREILPQNLRVGRRGQAEVRMVKADIKALARSLDGSGMAYEHVDVVGKSLTVRLKAPDQSSYVEPTSPETLWIESAGAVARDDVAIWSWAITPRRAGRLPLVLSVSARTIGADGFPAETAFPDRAVEIKVRRDLRALLARLALAAGLIIAGAALAHWSGPLARIVSSLVLGRG